MHGSNDAAEENMFVTSGDAITVLNSKDMAIKTYTPPFVPVSQSQYMTGSSSSLIDDQTPPKFTQIKYIKTTGLGLGAQNKHRVTTGIIAGTDKGNIQIFAYPLAVELPLQSPLLDQITAHAGEITKIILSPDNRFLFSAGTDGSLFIFSVGEQQLTFDKHGQLISNSTTAVASGHDDDKMVHDGAGSGGPSDSNSHQIVDEALADIVLVRK